MRGWNATILSHIKPASKHAARVGAIVQNKVVYTTGA